MCTYFLPEKLPNGLDVASSGPLQRRAFTRSLLSLCSLCTLPAAPALWNACPVEFPDFSGTPLGIQQGGPIPLG